MLIWNNYMRVRRRNKRCGDDRGDRHTCSVPEAAAKYACVRFALSSPFIPFRRIRRGGRRIHSHWLDSTRTPSLSRSRRIHPIHPMPTLSSRNRYRVRRYDISRAVPIGVIFSETHHSRHVTPGLEICAHYAPM